MLTSWEKGVFVFPSLFLCVCVSLCVCVCMCACVCVHMCVCVCVRERECMFCEQVRVILLFRHIFHYTGGRRGHLDGWRGGCNKAAVRQERVVSSYHSFSFCFCFSGNMRSKGKFFLWPTAAQKFVWECWTDFVGNTWIKIYVHDSVLAQSKKTQLCLLFMHLFIKSYLYTH